jgi:hypothetical protein
MRRMAAWRGFKRSAQERIDLIAHPGLVESVDMQPPDRGNRIAKRIAKRVLTTSATGAIIGAERSPPSGFLWR